MSIYGRQLPGVPGGEWYEGGPAGGQWQDGGGQGKAILVAHHSLPTVHHCALVVPVANHKSAVLDEEV